MLIGGIIYVFLILYIFDIFLHRFIYKIPIIYYTMNLCDFIGTSYRYFTLLS